VRQELERVLPPVIAVLDLYLALVICLSFLFKMSMISIAC